ncbi:MAG: hypothetical protein LCH83_10735 [Proteobacteria bacterium]|nr:hypothetical protein [Pseudomonadota bacterium]
MGLLINSPAFAQNDNIFSFNETTPPIIEVVVKSQTLRLAIDTSISEVIVINPDAARRIGYNEKSFFHLKGGFDGQKLDSVIKFDKATFKGKTVNAAIVFFPKSNGLRPIESKFALDGTIGVALLSSLGKVSFVNPKGLNSNTLNVKFKSKTTSNFKQVIKNTKFNVAINTSDNSRLSDYAADYLIGKNLLSEEGEIRGKKEYFLGLQKQNRQIKNTGLTFMGLTPEYFNVALQDKNYDELTSFEKEKAEAEAKGIGIVKVAQLKNKNKPISIEIGIETIGKCSNMTLDFKSSIMSISC